MGNDGKIDCRLCGERHRPGPTCPKFMVKAARVVVIDNTAEQANVPEQRDSRNRKPRSVDNGMANTPPPMANSVANKPAAAPSYKYRDADRRREYQRDLMRRKRAETRAAKGAVK